jgi:hypothetical protein
VHVLGQCMQVDMHHLHVCDVNLGCAWGDVLQDKTTLPPLASIE